MLKPVVTSLDGISDAVKGFYKEVDGKFHLQVEKTDGWELTNTTDLMSALQKERENARKSADQVKTITGQFEAAQAKIKEFGSLDIDGRVQAGIKEREAQLIKQHDTEKATLQSKLDRYNKAIHGLTVVNTARAALIESGAESIDLVLPIMTAQMGIREDGDQVFPIVLGPNREERVGGTKDGQAVPMTPKQLAEELKADKRYSAAWKGSGASGSGATGGGSGGSSQPDVSKLSPQEKMRWGRKNQNT